jgi:hypothetical protein
MPGETTRRLEVTFEEREDSAVALGFEPLEQKERARSETQRNTRG